MPQLKQFQALGDAAGWCAIGLDLATCVARSSRRR
jgi:hypothetical protein